MKQVNRQLARGDEKKGQESANVVMFGTLFEYLLGGKKAPKESRWLRLNGRRLRLQHLEIPRAGKCKGEGVLEARLAREPKKGIDVDLLVPEIPRGGEVAEDARLRE